MKIYNKISYCYNNINLSTLSHLFHSIPFHFIPYSILNCTVVQFRIVLALFSASIWLCLDLVLMSDLLVSSLWPTGLDWTLGFLACCSLCSRKLVSIFIVSFRIRLFDIINRKKHAIYIYIYLYLYSYTIRYIYHV